MIRCTEKRRGRRIIKAKQWKSRRHRRCIERRCLFANTISNLYTKRLPQNSYQESVRYISVALCGVGTSVTLCVTSVPSVTPCAYYIRRLVYHAIFRKSILLGSKKYVISVFFMVLRLSTIGAYHEHNMCSALIQR